VFADIDEETAKSSSEESKKYASSKEYQTAVFKMNVTDADSVQNMVNFMVEKFGRLDYCVNGAGVSALPSPQKVRGGIDLV
jgi:NAD(P)-dependent dehydrogenase (short-subunit alcohol dehydrogenase family)